MTAKERAQKAQEISLLVRNEKREATKEEFLFIFGESAGLVATACSKANISRTTYYRWRKEDEDFAQKADDVKELQKDAAEALILKKMKDGDTSMLIFYAKTQMKDRGYVERRELVGKDGKDLVQHDEADLSKLTPEQREALLCLGNDILSRKEE